MRTRTLAVSILGAAVLSAAVVVTLALERGWTWNQPDPGRFPRLGLDVSHHQAAIDWAAVAADGRFSFAYVKATEGADWTDPAFARNWSGARRGGLRVGAYHFFTFCTPGAEQARHFLAVVPGDPQALPPALDVEGGGPCSPPPSRQALLREIAAWCGAVEAALGKRPVIYVTRTSYRELLAGSGLPYPLWIRDLATEPRPAAGEAWAFWQYHSRGRVRGVSGPVDLDAYRAAAGPFEAL